MIIYHTTLKVDKAIAEEWLQWFVKEQVPAILATTCFTAYTLVRLLEVDDTEGPTYAVQFRASDLAAYTKYSNEFEGYFNQASYNKWGEGVVDFSTIMEVIQE